MSPENPDALSPADRRLWEALQQHARETRQTQCRRALILLADGAGVEIDARGARVDLSGDTPGEHPSPDGWSFRAGEAGYRGRRVRVAGVRLRLLRILAARPGEPVRDRAVKLAVWGDGAVEDGRLKDVAFQLRALLRAVLDLPEDADPVERVEGGYTLTLT